MEIKVLVDGILRVVSGATYDTTCQDVVVALAYAWDRTGRFTLFEKWRHSTRPLAPDERPLRLLHKWGEYAPEVHFILCQPNTEDAKQPVRDKLLRKRREQQAFSPDALLPHRTRTDGTGNVKRSLTFTGACSPRPRTSVLSSSAPTKKFRKTQKGPVPNGDVREMSGSAHHSSPPSQSLGKQQRRIEGDRQGQAPGRVQPPAHPVPPPRHRVSSIPSHQEVVHSSALTSSSPVSTSDLPSSPASTSDLPWSSDKNSVSSFQPSPAGQLPPVSSVSSVPHALPDTLSPSQPKSQPQTSSQPQPKSQPQTSSQPQQKFQPQTSQPQTSSQPQPKSQPQTSPELQQKSQTQTVTSVQGHQTGIHPQTQHTTPSVHPPPLPSSPPPSSAVPVGRPDPGSAQGAEESLDLVEDSAVSPSFSRQASLEIEEYDLEHNFPDPHRDHGHTDRPSVGLEYCLDQEMESGTRAEDQLNGEHASLVQLVNTLQEQLQTQESQIGFINTEITALEEKEKAYEEKLHIIMEDLLLYEDRQRDLELQLNDLEKVEWENVLDGEKKCEVDLTLNIASMKAAIIEHEEKLASTKTRESQLFSELKEEEEKVNQEKERLKIEEARVREEEGKMKEEISKLQTVLAEEQAKTTDCEASLSSLDVELKSVEKDLTEKEAALTETEAKLKDENLKDLLAHPPPKEDPKSGETVLKILEGRLSPRPPTSPSSKTPFIATLTSSSQSGVWV